MILVAIVYHSKPSALEQCLASLPLAHDDVRAVVVDTSTEGTARPLVLAHSEVGYLARPRNAGYAWALHEAAREHLLDPHWTFIGCNSDLVFAGGALEALAEVATELHGVAYPLQMDENDDPASYCIHPQLSPAEAVSRWLGLGRSRYRQIVDRVIQTAASTKQPVQIPRGFAGSGAAFAIEGKLWWHTAGYDPQFFLFEEDRSFGHTMDRLDVPGYLCGNATVQHSGGFRTLGPNTFATIECIVSEDLNWARSELGSRSRLLILQSLGLIGRLFRAGITLDHERLTVSGSALVYRLQHLRKSSVGPKGDDGWRLPSVARLHEHEGGGR